jgi:hypothetical protein
VIAAGTLNAAVFVQADSSLILDAEEVRFNWMAYNIGATSKLYANVKRTIAEDNAFSFAFTGAYILATNGATNVDVRFDGDFFTTKLLDDIDIGSAVVSFWNGSSGRIVVNGRYSRVRQQTIILVSSCPGAEVIVNTDIINTQGGLGVPGIGCTMDSGTVVLRKKLTTGGDPLDNTVELSGTGNLILDGAVLIANAAAESINAPAPITYKCYSGFTNVVTDVNATNSIAGTTLIVDAGVE